MSDAQLGASAERVSWQSGEPGPGNMQLQRHRDNQQWLLDYLVKTTGRDRQYFYDDRKLPSSVSSYAMIPRHLERVARHKRVLAQQAEEHGHYETALRLYQRAAADYHLAQHALPYDDHPEKHYLHGQLQACFDRFIALNPHPTERLEIPWEGHALDGVLYLASSQPAPTVLHINGMDMVKEALPDPVDNPYTARGLNVAIVDGPGQGTSTVRGLRLRRDNFASAMMTVLDYLVARPEVDAERIGCVGISMGTFWGMQLAARDERVKAIAMHGGCYGPMRALFQQASPHFKRQFMFMTGIMDEVAFDEAAETFVLTREEVASVRCPVLLMHGEYDPLCPLEDAYRVYQALPGPKEFWLTEDDAHTPTNHPHLGGLTALQVMVDWVRDVERGRIPPREGRLKILQEHAGAGPYSAPVSGFWLPERLEQPD